MNELTHFVLKRPQQKGNKIGLEECYHFYKSLSILYECDSQKMKIDEGVCKALTIRYYILDIISYINKTTHTQDLTPNPINWFNKLSNEKIIECGLRAVHFCMNSSKSLPQAGNKS